MLQNFRCPAWCQEVVVTADAAYASRANLSETVTAREVVGVYRRRWAVELLFKELKGATGLGQHQVTKAPQRIERSVAISIMAYLMLLKFRAHDIPKHGS